MKISHKQVFPCGLNLILHEIYLLLLRVKVVVLSSNDLWVEEVGKATHNALGTGILSDKLAS